MILICRIVYILLALHTITTADLTTSEKIKRHKEWLRNRLQKKNNFTELPKFWRTDNNFNKLILQLKFKPTDIKNETSMNDVYPETEITTKIPDAIAATEIFNTISSIPDIQTTTIATLIETTTLNEEQETTTFTNTLSTLATDKEEIANPTTVPPKIKIRKVKVRYFPHWGNWTKWSECSRNCGGGVMYQQRRCISRRPNSGKKFLSKRCVGVYRRYHLCNEQPCTDITTDFRHQQCSSFNNVEFQGKTYNWEPYHKDDAECELNCKPIGMQYFATLNHTVIDGTSCFRPAEFYRRNYRGRAICVEGICKAIHASGVITGLYANSGTVGCGGLICKPVSGIFTKTPLPEDAYIHVATIPAGASNISITELKNSKNLLVLRKSDKYLFNGDNIESPSAVYESGGISFDYRRIDDINSGDGVTEWITCTGPIRDALELLIYAKESNPGVKYEYMLPITSDSEENEMSIESDAFNLKSSDSDDQGHKRKFNWKVVGFSPCSKTCGGGMQNPVIRCVRENVSRYFSQRRCSHSEKPILNENLLRCNTQPCPAYWHVEKWSECQCSHQGEGFKERKVRCVQQLTNGVIVGVNDSECYKAEPPMKKECDCSKSRKRSHHNHHKTKVMSSRLGNTIAANHNVSDKTGIWLSSDWNKQCSVKCGPGIEHRSIFCDRSGARKERCDLRLTPDTTRPCEKPKFCETGEWFVGPWGNCSGSCFNLTKTRQVFCMLNNLIVDDEQCKTDEKPLTLNNCTHDQVTYCKPKWHYSEWSECTKTCDSGSQRRSVKCLEFDTKENVLKDSVKCRYSERELIYRSCNTQNCPDIRVDYVQNDIATDCIDEFVNCNLIAKAKLCSYEYYKQNCCQTCTA